MAKVIFVWMQIIHGISWIMCGLLSIKILKSPIWLCKLKRSSSVCDSKKSFMYRGNWADTVRGWGLHLARRRPHPWRPNCHVTPRVQLTCVASSRKSLPSATTKKYKAIWNHPKGEFGELVTCNLLNELVKCYPPPLLRAMTRVGAS